MEKSSLFLGIDIGGTNTVTGLVNCNGEFIEKHSFLTFADKPLNMFQENLDQVIAPLINVETNHIKGIGIGMPGANFQTGLVDNPVNFSWGNINLVKIIQDRYKLPVSVINDAKAAALGEMAFGQARDLDNFILVTLGTGLGSSFVNNKKIIHGYDGLAGELGHTKVDPKNRLCQCGQRGCLETYVSASGVCRTVFELISSEKKYTPLMNYNFTDLSSRVVTEWASKGDETAIKAYAITGRMLGEKLADFVNVFNPEAILFSGGLVAAGSYLFKPLEKAMNENLLLTHKNKTQIRISDPGVNYAVLGAASLFMKQRGDHV